MAINSNIALNCLQAIDVDYSHILDWKIKPEGPYKASATLD
jgi:hypothetical protein